MVPHEIFRGMYFARNIYGNIFWLYLFTDTIVHILGSELRDIFLGGYNYTVVHILGSKVTIFLGVENLAIDLSLYLWVIWCSCVGNIVLGCTKFAALVPARAR